ncbi:MAG: hypothetical protein NC308_05530 [Clostridium sp.]|nr:hypothetical protein [Bacteroides sp.]MCM1198330.1 hypothetical protein [Clostridium sp.]
MGILLAAIILVGLCVIGLCFNIIFRKDGRFPDTEISHNKEMRKRGIVCAKEDELRLWGRKNGKAHPTCSDLGCGDCGGCDILTEKSSRDGNE